MGKQVITDGSKIPIRPEHIDASKHLWDAFGNSETETSAGYIVRLCQEIGEWKSFTYEQIETFYRKSGFVNYTFNSLLSRGWIVEFNGMYHITIEFVANCYKSSPAAVAA